MKSVEEIRQLITEEKEVTARLYEAEARVYRAVRRKQKKDGSDFVDFRQNFEFTDGVTGHFEDGYGAGDISLKITFTTEDNGRSVYHTLWEQCYENCDERYEDYEKIRKEHVIKQRAEGLKDFYLYTPAEFLEILEKRAQRAEKRAALLRQNSDIEARGAEMFELLKKYLEIKDEVESLRDDADNYWIGAYSPIQRILESEILYKIR